MNTSFDMHTPEAGKDAVEYVRIELSPAEVIHRPATDEDKKKYSAEYAEFSKTGNRPDAKAKEGAADQKAQGAQIAPNEAGTAESPSDSGETKHTRKHYK